ncbi:MAG: lipid-A-disaccharide synthase, partial [Methylococcaceae bacterium]
VWAWKENRVKQMKKHIDRLMVILPFEKEFFAKRGMKVDFVGHPLIDEVEARKIKSEIQKENVIALLPGSRKQEINHILPVMLQLQQVFPDHQFIIGKAPSMDLSFYQKGFDLGKAEISIDGTSHLLARSKAALVASGTATLETALLNVPQVVCYKASSISVMIARQLIKVPYISLVNLILDKAAVKELIQDEMTVENISSELKLLLESNKRKAQMEADYRMLWTLLGAGGASERAAALIVGDMRNQ